MFESVSLNIKASVGWMAKEKAAAMSDAFTQNTRGRIQLHVIDVNQEI